MKPGPDEHPLQYSYTFWFSRRSPGKASTQSYDQNLKKIGAFASVGYSANLFLNAFTCVCLSVCLLVNSKSYERIRMKFLLKEQAVRFWWQSTVPGSGSGSRNF